MRRLEPHGSARRQWWSPSVPTNTRFDQSLLLIRLGAQQTACSWLPDTNVRQERSCCSTVLNPSWRSLEDIEWASLLPPPDMTRWISFDEHERYIEIDPAAVVPDPP